MEQLTAQAIQANLDDVYRQIDAACTRSNRDSRDVTLIAVTKKRTILEMLAALDHHVTHVGENRVEEAVEKHPKLAERRVSTTWHMIGHIQSRKAREVAQYFDVAHSVDSIKLAHRISEFGVEFDRTLEVLLQVNVSGEESKYGIPLANWENSRTLRDDFWELIHAIQQYEGIRLTGLMTMAPFVDNAEQVRPLFASMRRLLDALRNDFDTINWRELSMGMTNDYTVAIEEGATMVRVGRAIFGERQA